MQGGCIAACAWYFLLPDHIHMFVSIEVLPFLPLLLAACVTCTLSVETPLHCPWAVMSSSYTLVEVDSGSMGCFVCPPSPFTASYDFRGEVCRFHRV